MRSNAGMANRQGDVDLRFVQVSAPQLALWLGLAWLGWWHSYPHYCLVAQIRDTSWRSGVRVPVGTRDFRFFKTSRPTLSSTQPLVQNVTGIFSGVKRPKRDGNHSSSPRDEVTNERSYNSTSLYAFMVWKGKIFPLLTCNPKKGRSLPHSLLSERALLLSPPLLLPQDLKTFLRIRYEPEERFRKFLRSVETQPSAPQRQPPSHVNQCVPA